MRKMAMALLGTAMVIGTATAGARADCLLSENIPFHKYTLRFDEEAYWETKTRRSPDYVSAQTFEGYVAVDEIWKYSETQMAELKAKGYAVVAPDRARFQLAGKMRLKSSGNLRDKMDFSLRSLSTRETVWSAKAPAEVISGKSPVDVAIEKLENCDDAE